MQLFVSYSSKDNTSVKTLIRDLEAARHGVWVDQELTGGDSWWREILQQIRRCDVFVLALSNNSLRSKPCIAELDYAKALGLPLVPVQIGPVDSPRLAPVAQIQIIDYRSPTAAMGIALVGALQEGAARRGELPDPLPEPPPIPYEYLMRLSTRIESPALQSADQLAIVSQLRESLEIEDDDGVRADLVALLGRLRSRADVTFRAANEIDAVLRQYDRTAAHPTTVTPSPQPSPGPSPPLSPGPTAPPPPGLTAPQQPNAPQHQPWNPAQPGRSPAMPPATSPPQHGQWYVPPAGQQVGSQPAQPASQQLATWGIVLGAVGLLIPILGLGGIVCAGMAKSRKQPLADVALAISLIATVLGFLIWTAAGL